MLEYRKETVEKEKNITTTLLEHPQLKNSSYWQGIIRTNESRLAAGTLALQQEF